MCVLEVFCEDEDDNDDEETLEYIFAVTLFDALPLTVTIDVPENKVFTRCNP